MILDVAAGDVGGLLGTESLGELPEVPAVGENRVLA